MEHCARLAEGLSRARSTQNSRWAKAAFLAFHHETHRFTLDFSPRTTPRKYLRLRRKLNQQREGPELGSWVAREHLGPQNRLFLCPLTRHVLNAHFRRSCSLSPLPQTEWLTAREAASHLRIEPRTLLLWARLGHIKGYVLSGTKRITWRFRAEDLDATLSAPSVALTKRRIQ